MELKAFLTYPGLHSLDDAHVLYSDGMAVDYPRLHNEIGESAFQVCQNYPSQLLKMGICDAQLLSFARFKGKAILARVFLGGKDADGRHLPITEIFIGPSTMTCSEAEKVSFTYPSEISRQGWPQDISSPKTSSLKRNRYSCKVVKEIDAVDNWNTEWRSAFWETGRFFDLGQHESGVSMCFEYPDYEGSSVCHYYPKTSHSLVRSISLAVGTVFVVLLGLFLMRHVFR